MDIKRLRITKLNGKYDFDINLDRRCTIIVGANGVGKTTILRIIEALNLFQFYELLKYRFDKIEYKCSIDDITEREIAIRYEDLLPKSEFLVNRFIDIYNSMNPEFKLSDKSRGKLLEVIKALNKSRALNGYVYDLMNNRTVNHDINVVLDSCNIYEFDKHMILTIESIYEQVPWICCFKDTALHSHLDELFNEHGESGIDCIRKIIQEKKQTYFFSMVKKICINQDNSIQSNVTSNKLRWLFSFESRDSSFEKGITDNKDLGEWSLFLYNTMLDRVFQHDLEFRVHFTSILRKIDDIKFERLITPSDDALNIHDDSIWHYKRSRNRHNIEYTSIDCVKDIDQIELENLIDNDSININNFVKRFYYNDDFQISINNRFCEFIADVLDGNIEKPSKQVIRNYLNMVHQDSYRQKLYDNYILPILAEELRIYYPKTYGFDGKRDNTNEGEYYVTKFFEKVKGEFEDDININPKVKKIQVLLNKYFYDKDVVFSPTGIHIYDKMDVEHNDEIDVSSISSGEIKILILLFVSVFGQSLKILIDEPELSLSISWQEEILNDIINNSECKLIVATHSPYIASNDKLAGAVEFVPLKGDEE